MYRKFLILVTASALMMLPMAAAQSQNSDSGPGMVGPDSPVYGLETAWDNAAVGIGLKKASNVANERVAEAEDMARKNNTEGMQRAAEEFGRMAERSLDNNETEIGQSIERMEQVIQNAPNEQARQGMENALGNMREAQQRRENAMQKGSNRNRPSERGTDDAEPPENPDDRTVPEPRSGPDQNEDGADYESNVSPEQDQGTTDETSQDTNTEPTSGTGDFDLLVSDQPADISTFDYVNVTFDRARVFRGEGEEENERMDGNESDSDNETDMNDTESMNETGEMNETENDTQENEGFQVVELDNSTVDLTTVVGEYAQSIAETELEAGTYTKIELYTENIDASVDGESVDVKVPPGKLMITKPFTVSENSSTEFVFDIGVVQRGQNNGYILQPVISESGVAGKDVDMKRGPSDSTEDTGGNETERGSQGGRPDGAGPS